MSGPAGRAGRAKALVAAVSLFLLGAVVGVAVDRHLAAPVAPAPGHAIHEAALASLHERLQLDAAQRRQVDSIIGARHETLQSTWAAIHRHLGATVDSVHRELEAVLTPDQRTEFRAWIAEITRPPRH